MLELFALRLPHNLNRRQLRLVRANAANHRLPKAAERGTSGAAFGSPSEFALLGDIIWKTSHEVGIFGKANYAIHLLYVFERYTRATRLFQNKIID